MTSARSIHALPTVRRRWSNAEPTATDRRERSRAIHGLLAPFLAQDRVQTGKYYESRAHTFTPDLDAAGLANEECWMHAKVARDEENKLPCFSVWPSYMMPSSRLLEMGGLQGLT